MSAFIKGIILGALGVVCLIAIVVPFFVWDSDDRRIWKFNAFRWFENKAAAVNTWFKDTWTSFSSKFSKAPEQEESAPVQYTEVSHTVI